MDREIDALQRRSAEAPGLIPLGGGLPAAETFPRAELASAFARLVREEDATALQYGWPEGRERLREAIAARLRARGADVRADDVVVTSGAQQAIALAADLTCERGDSVLTAPASYPAALDLFRLRALSATCETSSGARVCYAMPAIGNPSGRSLDADARARLLGSGLPIIEDDAYADIYFGASVPAPLLARARDRVFYVGSFSKTLAPGLRVGYLVPPRARVADVQKHKQVQDLEANSLSQALVEAYLVESDFEAHLARLRAFYARRADALACALRTQLPGLRFDAPQGGFSIWVETDIAGDEAALLACAITHGTSFDPGRDFRVCAGDERVSFRLSYASIDEHEAKEGVRRLSRALVAHARARRGDAHRPPDRDVA